MTTKDIIANFGLIASTVLFLFAAFKFWREYIASSEAKLKMRVDGDITIAREKSTGIAAYEDLMKRLREIASDITAIQKKIDDIREDRITEKEELQTRLDKLKTHLEALIQAIISKH